MSEVKDVGKYNSKNSCNKFMNLIVIFVDYLNGFKILYLVQPFQFLQIKQTVRQSDNEYRCRFQNRLRNLNFCGLRESFP